MKITAPAALTLAFLLTTSLIHAQNTPEAKPKELQVEEIVVSDDEDPIFEVVEDPAQFPGGEKALMRYIAKNLVYPEEAKKGKIQGKVYVEFIVRPDGSITDIKMLRSIGEPKHGIDNAVIDLLKKMPKWKPGYQNNKAIAMRYRLPIIFKL